METSQPLAIESFSYSWLSNVKPSLDGFDELLIASLDSSHEATFNELDNTMAKSKRLLTEAQNFNFDVPNSQSSIALVHADELFSNGLIKPVFVEPLKIEAFNNSDSTPIMPGSSSSSRTVIPAILLRCHILGRWRKASERIFQKCFGYLRPLCCKVGCSRKSIRVDDIDRRVWEAKSWSNSPQASPQRSTAYSVGDWCDLESSIYEAVLHCKRSIEKK